MKTKAFKDLSSLSREQAVEIIQGRVELPCETLEQASFMVSMADNPKKLEIVKVGFDSERPYLICVRKLAK